jgi:hypothetical protein
MNSLEYFRSKKRDYVVILQGTIRHSGDFLPCRLPRGRKPKDLRERSDETTKERVDTTTLNNSIIID